MRLRRAESVANDGSVWYGTTRGFARYHHGQTTFFDRVGDLRLGNVLAIQCVSSNEVWIASDQGLLLCDGNRVRLMGTADGLTNPSVTALFLARNQTLWVATSTGLFRWTGKSFIREMRDTPRDLELDIQAICENQAGLFRYDAAGISKCSIPNSNRDAKSPLDDHIWCLHEARDHRLWLGTANMGAAVFDGVHQYRQPRRPWR